VVPERVYLTLGVRLEHNEYTGLVTQPNARIALATESARYFVGRGVERGKNAN
jgi:hypothetical protein